MEALTPYLPGPSLVLLSRTCRYSHEVLAHVVQAWRAKIPRIVCASPSYTVTLYDNHMAVMRYTGERCQFMRTLHCGFAVNSKPVAVVRMIGQDRILLRVLDDTGFLVLADMTPPEEMGINYYSRRWCR